jgi:hypothetical protein
VNFFKNGYLIDCRFIIRIVQCSTYYTALNDRMIKLDELAGCERYLSTNVVLNTLFLYIIKSVVFPKMFFFEKVEYSKHV